MTSKTAGRCAAGRGRAGMDSFFMDGASAFRASPRTGVNRSGGFTLLEMLITMLLTALIGSVLFSTYRNVTDSARDARKYVEAREHPRMLRAIFDDDLSSMLAVYDARLPFLSRTHIDVGASYSEATGYERRRSRADDEEILFSFATTSGLFPEERGHAAGLYCVEYVVKEVNGKNALCRRERPHCGVEGIFEWSELLLLSSVYKVTTDVWPKGGEAFVQEWESMRSSDDVPGAIRFHIWHSAQDSLPETLVIHLPDRFTHAP